MSDHIVSCSSEYIYDTISAPQAEGIITEGVGVKDCQSQRTVMTTSSYCLQEMTMSLNNMVETRLA